MRGREYFYGYPMRTKFPFLFGGTFIEGELLLLSRKRAAGFPFLFGGTFIEGSKKKMKGVSGGRFPFLFGGTFIEGTSMLCAITSKL